MDKIINKIQRELSSTRNKYPPFHSSHEGLGVILEEWDELKEAVRNNNISQQRTEAIQLAAMAIRFIQDCCDSGNNNSIT